MGVRGTLGLKSKISRGDCHVPGIPEAERERVFSPFHRLSKDSAGTGLGLSLVRQIARLHGGDAIVAPRPSRPSCFGVTLPANTR